MGLIVAAILIPFKQLWPFLFALVNTYRSSTLMLRDEIHRKYSEKRKLWNGKRRKDVNKFKQDVAAAKAHTANRSQQRNTRVLPLPHIVEGEVEVSRPPAAALPDPDAPVALRPTDVMDDHAAFKKSLTSHSVYSAVPDQHVVAAPGMVATDAALSVTRVERSPPEVKPDVMSNSGSDDGDRYYDEDDGMSLSSFRTASGPLDDSPSHAASGSKRPYRLPKLELERERESFRKRLAEIANPANAYAVTQSPPKAASPPTAKRSSPQRAPLTSQRSFLQRLRVGGSSRQLDRFASEDILAEANTDVVQDASARFDPVAWAILSVTSIMQSFTGFYVAAQGIYFVTTGADRSLTVLVLALGGCIMAVLAMLAFSAVKLGRFVLATGYLLASFGVEAGAGCILHFFQLPQRNLSMIIVIAVQAAGLFIAAVSMMWILHSRKRALRDHADETVLVEKLKVEVRRLRRRKSFDARTKLAAKKLVHALRGYRLRVMKARSAELDVWNALAIERRILRALVYCVLVVLAAFFAYINLLYGATFTASQNSQWISAFFTALLMGECSLKSHPLMQQLMFAHNAFWFLVLILS